MGRQVELNVNGQTLYAVLEGGPIWALKKPVQGKSKMYVMGKFIANPDATEEKILEKIQELL